jgi:hypothetical protein
MSGPSYTALLCIPLSNRCEQMVSSFYFVALPEVEFIVVLLSLGEV